MYTGGEAWYVNVWSGVQLEGVYGVGECTHEGQFF